MKGSKPRSPEVAADRIVAGKSWAEFCDLLKAAGLVITNPKAPNTPFDSAEGFRYLSRLTRVALEAFVEHADPKAPVLMRVVHETAKMGSDNPDNYYQNAAISGLHEYKITGTRGTVPILSFSTQVGNYGEGMGMPQSGYLDGRDLDVSDDGSFEIVVSCREQAGNWLPMKPESGTLIVRQTFLDRANESRADMRIERIGSAKDPSLVTAQQIDGGLQAAGMLVAGASRLFQNWAENFERHENELPQMDPDFSTAFGSDPNIAYFHSYWRLGPDEALVIEATPPECIHWNFQLNNHWMELLDYRYFNVHVNKHTARLRDDGSVRVVVAHQDPAVANWIQTVGHSFGTMCWRWVGASSNPQPKTTVVKLAELREPRQ